MKSAEFNHKTGNYLEIDGANIYYEEIENVGKPTLLFLHGGMGNMADYNPIVSLFSNDYHIVGVDSRGHGKSTLGTDRLTYKRLQLDVEAIVNHLQLKNINIIGFSDGGVVAYRLALDNNISIQKIVTIGALCSQSCPELNEKFFEGVTTDDYKIGFKQNFYFYEQHNPQPDIDKFIKCIEEMWFDKTENGYPNKIENINIPVLIVRGNDDMDSLENYVEMTAQLKNSILFNIPFEGHLAWEKYPRFLVEVTKDFLNKNEFLYIVTENYQTEFTNPITLTMGEKVTIGEDPDPKMNPDTWINWAYCIKEDGSNAGFVPEQIIKKDGNTGIILEDYSAKEMSVEKGGIVEGIKELNGWLLAKNKATGETGWIPLENLEIRK